MSELEALYIIVILIICVYWVNKASYACDHLVDNPYVDDLTNKGYQNIYDWVSIDDQAIRNSMQIAETDRSDWLYNNAIRYKIIQNGQRANLVKTG